MKGLVYFARNPAFQHLTKIGKTTKDSVEERGLTASNVPEDFDYLAILQCDDCDWVEDKIHTQYSKYRHKSATGRSTEFFWSGCIEDAIKYALDLKGVKNVTQEETEDFEAVIDGKREKTKRPRTTFEMIGIPVGEKIFFENDLGRWAVIKDNKNQISYLGQPNRTISNVSDELCHRGTNGFEHFYYKGKKLFDMRPDRQQEDDIMNKNN